jgi:hypothetical protein
MTRQDFDLREVRRGAKVEHEHTGNMALAERIAMDHLVEDPRYYDKLAKVEGRERGQPRRRRHKHPPRKTRCPVCGV